MAWIESHQSLADHPKTKRLARLLKASRYEAIGVLHCLWWWTLDYAEDGDLSRYTDEDVADGINWPGEPSELVSALQASGFLTEDRSINDWDEYAGRIVERREQSRERQRRYRARTSQTDDSLTSIQSQPRYAAVTRDSRVSNGPTNQPTGTNQPEPTGVRARAQAANAAPTKPSVPKPNRISEFIDAIREIDADVPVDISAMDGAAIKASSVKPSRLAQAFVAAFRGEWGDDWFRENLSPKLVVSRIAGYETHLRAPPRPKNGQTAVTTANDVEAARRRYATTLAGGPAS